MPPLLRPNHPLSPSLQPPHLTYKPLYLLQPLLILATPLPLSNPHTSARAATRLGAVAVVCPTTWSANAGIPSGCLIVPRRPMIPLPVGCVPVQAVPFVALDGDRLSSTTSPLPPSTSAPPPSPLVTPPPFMAAFDSLHLITSSSSSSPDFQQPHTPILPTPPSVTPPCSASPSLSRSPFHHHLPSLLEIHTTTSPTRPAPPSSIGPPTSGSGGRSPPPVTSPVRMPEPSPTPAMDAAASSNPGSDHVDDEFVDSYGSPNRASSLAASAFEDDIL